MYVFQKFNKNIKEKTMENGNFRLFARNKKHKQTFVCFLQNRKWKFVFLGGQSINGN
jgi:hypothetical protein